MDQHAHVRECTHTNGWSIYTLLFFVFCPTHPPTLPLSYMGAEDGEAQLTFVAINLECCMFFLSFCIYILGYGPKKKKKIKIKNRKKEDHKKKTYKNTQHCTLQTGNIYSQFCSFFVTSMWHHYLFCWCVEVALWVPGSGPAPPLLSATFNTIKLSAITKVLIPQSPGHSHFKCMSIDCAFKLVNRSQMISNVSQPNKVEHKSLREVSFCNFYWCVHTRTYYL